MFSPLHNLTLGYALAALGLLSLLVFWVLCVLVLRLLKWLGFLPVFCHVKHALLMQIRPLAISYMDFVSSFGFVVLNILLIAIPASDWSKVSRRCTLMATINLVPLLLGERLHLMGKICHIRLTISALGHRILGITTVLEVVAHIVITARHHHFNFHTRADWGAILVGDNVARE